MEDTKKFRFEIGDIWEDREGKQYRVRGLYGCREYPVVVEPLFGSGKFLTYCRDGRHSSRYEGISDLVRLVSRSDEEKVGDTIERGGEVDAMPRGIKITPIINLDHPKNSPEIRPYAAVIGIIFFLMLACLVIAFLRLQAMESALAAAARV